MQTFEITYDNGALPGVMVSCGRDLLDAIRNAGYRNAEAFNWSRVITWKVL